MMGEGELYKNRGKNCAILSMDFSERTIYTELTLKI